MLKENAFLGAIKDLAPESSTDTETPLPKKAQLVRVNFEEERVGYLDLSYPRAKVWRRIIAYLQERNRPVYVETDPDTRIITTLCIPEAAKVLKIQPPGEDVVYVAFLTSSARHYLRRDHPNYQDMLDALHQALDTGTTILVTSTLHKFEIIDVRPMPTSYGVEQPPSPPSPHVPDPPVSWERAVELFNMMKELSCEPCSAASPCISYLYPYNGCWIRAHLMCYLMMDEEETPEKIWLNDSDTGCDLYVPTPNAPECAISWCWHVAPTLWVEQDSGPNIKMVIDPSLCCEPVTLEQWRLIQTDTSAPLIPSSWEQYKLGAETATREQAEDDMELYRNLLNDLCDSNGPPPYNCPTIRYCTLVTDRSTFGEDEVAVMLADGASARFENAFYVILNGFSPQELGITSFDTTEVAPSIIMDQTVAGMMVPDDPYFSAEYQDLDHLECRQRLTWRYRVEFTSTDAFTFPAEVPLQITLTASIASVSDEAIIRLIRQASPYEVDGETHWLSDALCVFQIKEGEDRFGETMVGSSPEAASTFITNVIRRLNENDTGGETFEDVRDDQQTYQLALYEQDGVGDDRKRVFNFAVARVHYRSAASPAQNVRVFFRLFPWTSTSLQYNLATAYRRGGHGDATIPLLGIQDDGALTTIPCFADTRHEPTPTEDMNWQRDIPNVQEIDATGDENQAYFGCWLDINQPTQELFPDYPSPWDGPFPTGREPIQEHIRGKHQCLVAEIAFDPDPIPEDATPAMSDKLAQRNLAIVESANPGEPASRRIPHTFDIRPTPAMLEADELPDELMIDWGSIPSGSFATIYMPGINAAAVFDRANEMYGSHRLTWVDEHTVQCQAGGITYMPIPPGLGANLAGLLSVDLPETVVRGQSYTIVVHQVTNAQGVVLAYDPDSPPPEPISWRRILGSFQLTIPVRAKEDLLEPEARLLSVMRWIQRAIPDDDRWFAVFRRYVDQIAARVDALGGNSSEVVPSPSGDWQASKAVIRARKRWNETRIWLEQGKTYQFTATGNWTDAFITTDAVGYRLWPFILFEGFRRAPESNWFALIGTIGRTETTRFLIGSGTQYSPSQSGYLYCFANDIRWFYWNNFGEINLEVREV